MSAEDWRVRALRAEENLAQAHVTMADLRAALSRTGEQHVQAHEREAVALGRARAAEAAAKGAQERADAAIRRAEDAERDVRGLHGTIDGLQSHFATVCTERDALAVRVKELEAIVDGTYREGMSAIGTLKTERDALAAQLAATREALDRVIELDAVGHPYTCAAWGNPPRGPCDCGWAAVGPLVDALLSSPSQAAEAWEVRIRSKTLEEAAAYARDLYEIVRSGAGCCDDSDAEREVLGRGSRLLQVAETLERHAQSGESLGRAMFEHPDRPGESFEARIRAEERAFCYAAAETAETEANQGHAGSRAIRALTPKPEGKS